MLTAVEDSAVDQNQRLVACRPFGRARVFVVELRGVSAYRCVRHVTVW